MPRPETSNTPSQSTKKVTEMRNISAEKLSHSDFNKMDNKIKTSSMSKKFGFNRTRCIEDAHGTKIQDFSILSKCLENFAMSSSCIHCGAKQNFTTSRKILGKGGAFEVNRKASLACSSRAQLQNFCNKMDFPPPVTKESHNNQLKEIEIEVKMEAEQKMKDAANRLLNVLKTEEPERITMMDDGK